MLVKIKEFKFIVRSLPQTGKVLFFLVKILPLDFE